MNKYFTFPFRIIYGLLLLVSYNGHSQMCNGHFYHLHRTDEIFKVKFSSVLEEGDWDGMSFEWDFGDGSPVSLATTPTHLYAASGSYTVCLKTITSSDDTCTVCQEICVGNVPSVTSLEIIDGIEKLEIFPNPSSDELQIHFFWTNNKTKPSSLELKAFNMKGEEIFNKGRELNYGKNILRISVKDWPKANYIFQFGIHNQIHSFHFQKI